MDLTDACFEILHLDKRATQKEVEIAYEVLSQDKKSTDKQIRDYRTAFEYLMVNFFNTVKLEDDDNEEYKEQSASEIAYSQIIEQVPYEIKDSIDELSTLVGEELNNRVKALLSVQNINLSMFITNIYKLKRKIFNFTFWTKKDMLKIFQNCCFNPLLYSTATFEVNYPVKDDRVKDLQKSIVNISKTYKKESYLCPVFDVKKTKLGVDVYATLETNHMNMLKVYLKNKSVQWDCNLNFVEI